MPINVGMYLRLSLADSDLGKDNKDESGSIENQRLLIRSYLERKAEFDGRVIEYVDDGYSGTNFDRPAFKKMLEDAKKGVIQVIIVKDLSRLGRDYIGVGDYLEQVFPSLGIRFIAINSNYDSINYIGKTLDLDTSISNLINSMYSKDLSKKVKTAYKTRWKAGINTSTTAPYGYIKRKGERIWDIDPETAEVVKKIFALASSGKNTKYIVDYLNKRKTPTPGEHLNQIAEHTNKSYSIKCKEPRWDKTKVHKIIRSVVYTGTMEHGNNYRLTVGSRVVKKAGRNEIIVVENDHPSIISEEVFYRAQDAINGITRTTPRVPQNNPLTGKIFCGNCGLSMMYTSGAITKICCAHGMSVGIYSNCNKEAVEAAQIEHVVLYNLRQQVKIIKALTQDVKAAREKDAGLFEQTRKTLSDSIESLNDNRLRLYERYANGFLSKEVYLSEKENLGMEQKKLQKQLEEMLEARSEEDTFLFEAERVTSRFARINNRSRLTKEIADAYIERVVLYDKENLEIEFRFEDALTEALKKKTSEDNYALCH